MIAGVFLRNFKSYSNLTFIPFIDHPSERVTVLIGENGVGKSTLIEAVNCYMHDVDSSQWDITVDKNGKSNTNKSGAYVGAVFLIKKEEIEDPDIIKIDKVSASFWTHEFTKTWSASDAVVIFEKWRNSLISQGVDKNYYLVAIGKNFDNEIKLTSFAHDRIMSQNRGKGLSREKLLLLNSYLLKNYGYIHIPVENKVSNVLRLQALELQQIMNKKIVDEIKDIFEKSIFGDGGSIVSLINNNLNNYVSEINIDLNGGYKFDSQGDEDDQIETEDIISLVFKEFFSRKILKKDGKNIKSLSSGQQRIALIEVISTILSKSADRTGRICLAIDEPESSLDNSNRLNQFIKLFLLSDIECNQVLITTHWYGLLLKPVQGRLIYIENNKDGDCVQDDVYDESLVAKTSDYSFRSYSLLNLYDQRRNFPESIEMKSYFDLMTSLWSIIRKNENNWLICEGYEDYLYLNHYLAGKVEDLIVLPFNGCGNVKKFYELLRIPLMDKSEGKNIKGKVFCLIDSDPEYIKVDNYKGHKNLVFKKFLLNNESTKVRLASVSEQNAKKTTIEDVLNVKFFIEAFKDLCDFDEDLLKIKGKLKFNLSAQYVDLNNNLSFLNSNKTSVAHQIVVRSALSKDENKKYLAKKYVENSDSSEMMEWLNEIIEYFKGE